MYTVYGNLWGLLFPNQEGRVAEGGMQLDSRPVYSWKRTKGTRIKHACIDTEQKSKKAHDRGRISTFCAGDEQGPDTISRWAGHSQRRPPPVAMP